MNDLYLGSVNSRIIIDKIFFRNIRYRNDGLAAAHDFAIAINRMQTVQCGDQFRSGGGIHLAPRQPDNPCGHARTHVDNVSRRLL